jgi:hemerythrin superfamily protein
MTQQDACALLDSDHERVERLFAQYQSEQDPARKSELAETVCMELTVHATIEEEIFYPAFRKASHDDAMVDEAEEEHQEVKDLITEIEDGDDIAPLMAQLQEMVAHHVKEERGEMFPKARKAPGLDLEALADQLEARKNELMENHHPI